MAVVAGGSSALQNISATQRHDACDCQSSSGGDTCGSSGLHSQRRMPPLVCKYMRVKLISVVIVSCLAAGI